MLKFFCLFGLIAFAASFDVFDEEGKCKSPACKFFENLKAESLLPEFRLPLNQILNKQKREATRWCCRNGLPVSYTLVTQHYVQWEPNGQTASVVTGSYSCGFLGLSSCTKYSISFIPTSSLGIGYEMVVDPNNSCQDENVVCCKGYMLVAGNCLTPSEFTELTNAWLALLPYIKDEIPNYSLQDLAFALINHGVNLQYTQTKPPNQ